MGFWTGAVQAAVRDTDVALAVHGLMRHVQLWEREVLRAKVASQLQEASVRDDAGMCTSSGSKA